MKMTDDELNRLIEEEKERKRSLNKKDEYEKLKKENIEKMNENSIISRLIKINRQISGV